jgi:hypothetical protein
MRADLGRALPVRQDEAGAASQQTGVIEIGLVVRNLEASMRFYGELVQR